MKEKSPPASIPVALAPPAGPTEGIISGNELFIVLSREVDLPSCPLLLLPKENTSPLSDKRRV